MPAFLLVPVFFLLSCALGLEAVIASGPPAPIAAPEAPAGDSVEVVFAQLQEAVRADDRTAVAALIRFPLAGIEAGQEAFFSDYYPLLLEGGDFRSTFLAASPNALEARGDESYVLMAHVGYTEAGDLVDGDDPEAEAESAMVFVFRSDGAGRWRLAEIHLAG